jgi:hypothetical protein
VEDIKVVLGSLQSWKINHVKRGANQAAHGLAKEAMVTSLERHWIEEIPSCIFNIVNLRVFCSFFLEWLASLVSCIL